MNKVLGFAPDSDPTTPGVLADCANLIPSEMGMRPGPSVTPVGVAAPSCNCVRAHMPKPERSVVSVGTAQAALSCGV